MAVQILLSTRLILNLRERFYEANETASEWGMPRHSPIRFGIQGSTLDEGIVST